ncbi:cell envelope biogenesis protein OmpA [Falsiroseomonas bella]|uniref:Cell envelope biogenesis protein OmpA n=1 Tax=Falsiroseomonas bella TaxID=2184016 RepID=A0A317FFK0_9PROT|nr:YMGG-like glycine zipper-containing protein [Falsiroseomonas bella]PWS37565.1 cell envelope biogenesis protein OmpA [Falsiroseomonas bella]
MRPRLPVLLLAPALALSACAGGVDPNDRNQRALGGAALGAGAGALIGSLSGDAGKGALIGGALGGVAGALTPAPQPERIPQQPYAASGYDPRYGGWYDQYGQWHNGPPPAGYQPNYR